MIHCSYRKQPLPWWGRDLTPGAKRRPHPWRSGARYPEDKSSWKLPESARVPPWLALAARGEPGCWVALWLQWNKHEIGLDTTASEHKLRINACYDYIWMNLQLWSASVTSNGVAIININNTELRYYNNCPSLKSLVWYHLKIMSVSVVTCKKLLFCANTNWNNLLIWSESIVNFSPSNAILVIINEV